MDNPPLAEITSLQALRNWMSNAGLTTLWDISCWNDSNWHSWKQLQVHLELQRNCEDLFVLLKGMAPIHVRRADKLGWGPLSGSYTMSLGYKKLQEQPYVPPNPATWKGLWRHNSIPKIDFFCWLICHNKILTEDRLKTRGFQGPSKFQLCCDNEENTGHILLK